MEVDGVTSLTLESWSNKTLVLIQKDGTVSFDGKIVDKAFLATLPKNEQDPYKEILRLANYVNSKKAYPENDAKRFAEFRKVFYK